MLQSHEESKRQAGCEVWRFATCYEFAAAKPKAASSSKLKPYRDGLPLTLQKAPDGKKYR